MLIHINSQDKNSGTNEDFTIDFNNIGNHHTSGGGIIGIKHAEIPYSWYVCRNNVNNAFVYIDSNSAESVIFLGNTIYPYEGSPSGSTLIANLISQLNSKATDGSVWTITLSPVTGKLTFTNTHNWGFIFGGTNPETNEVLGFTSQTVTQLASPWTVTADNVANLAPNKYLYIRTTLPIAAHDYDSFTDNNSDVFAKIPITVNPYSNVYYEEKNPVYRTCASLTTAKFKLTDHKNRIIDLNGIPWSLSLEFKK